MLGSATACGALRLAVELRCLTTWPKWGQRVDRDGMGKVCEVYPVAALHLLDAEGTYRPGPSRDQRCSLGWSTSSERDAKTGVRRSR